jgi:hypothetical protein
MKISPEMFIMATSVENLRQTDTVKGLYELETPATLVHTETGEAVEVTKFFHDRGNAVESMVRVAQPSKLPPWVPLAQFELPSAVAKLLATRTIREFDRRNKSAG